MPRIGVRPPAPSAPRSSGSWPTAGGLPGATPLAQIPHPCDSIPTRNRIVDDLQDLPRRQQDRCRTPAVPRHDGRPCAPADPPLPVDPVRREDRLRFGDLRRREPQMGIWICDLVPLSPAFAISNRPPETEAIASTSVSPTPCVKEASSAVPSVSIAPRSPVTGASSITLRRTNPATSGRVPLPPRCASHAGVEVGILDEMPQGLAEPLGIPADRWGVGGEMDQQFLGLSSILGPPLLKLLQDRPQIDAAQRGLDGKAHLRRAASRVSSIRRTRWAAASRIRAISPLRPSVEAAPSAPPMAVRRLISSPTEGARWVSMEEANLQAGDLPCRLHFVSLDGAFEARDPDEHPGPCGDLFGGGGKGEELVGPSPIMDGMASPGERIQRVGPSLLVPGLPGRGDSMTRTRSPFRCGRKAVRSAGPSSTIQPWGEGHCGPGGGARLGGRGEEREWVSWNLLCEFIGPEGRGLRRPGLIRRGSSPSFSRRAERPIDRSRILPAGGGSVVRTPRGRDRTRKAGCRGRSGRCANLGGQHPFSDRTHLLRNLLLLMWPGAAEAQVGEARAIPFGSATSSIGSTSIPPTRARTASIAHRRAGTSR